MYKNDLVSKSPTLNVTLVFPHRSIRLWLNWPKLWSSNFYETGTNIKDICPTLNGLYNQSPKIEDEFRLPSDARDLYPKKFIFSKSNKNFSHFFLKICVLLKFCFRTMWNGSLKPCAHIKCRATSLTFGPNICCSISTTALLIFLRNTLCPICPWILFLAGSPFTKVNPPTPLR